MQSLLEFLSIRLQQPLPHDNIDNEGIPFQLLELLKKAQGRAKNMMQEHPPKICAVMIAFYEINNELFVPMMLRPIKSRVHPNQVAFPGGKREEGDQDLKDTAIREMEEEIGINVPKSQVIGQLTPVFIPPSNALVTPIIGYLTQKPNYIPSPDEVAEVLDVKITDLRNPNNMNIHKAVISKDDAIDMPAYKANGKVIWGGTARMITELNKLLYEFDKQYKPKPFFDIK